MVSQQDRQRGGLCLRLGPPQSSFDQVGLDRLGDRPDPPGWSVVGAVDEKLVDDQSGVIKSISIGKAVQRIDIGLHRTAADLLEAPQQPDPFVVVSGLDEAAGDAIGRLEGGREVLAQNAGIGSEEARGKQAEQLFCPRQVACIARTFPQGKKPLEQMHVRVLAAKAIGGRQAFQEAIAVGRAEIAGR